MRPNSPEAANGSPFVGSAAQRSPLQVIMFIQSQAVFATTRLGIATGARSVAVEVICSYTSQGEPVAAITLSGRLCACIGITFTEAEIGTLLVCHQLILLYSTDKSSLSITIANMLTSVH